MIFDDRKQSTIIKEFSQDKQKRKIKQGMHNYNGLVRINK